MTQQISVSMTRIRGSIEHPVDGHTVYLIYRPGQTNLPCFLGICTCRKAKVLNPRSVREKEEWKREGRRKKKGGGERGEGRL